MADNFDRFLPDYQIGTLTIEAANTTFTATDAALTLAAIREGDTIITPGGLTLVIASITDDNTGELAEPAPAEAAGTFQTRIRFQSDNSRYTGQQSVLIRLLSGGNLFSLGKLDGDPETLVMFDGLGNFSLVSKDDVGIQDPNGNLADLADLELAARQILQTNAQGKLTPLQLAARQILQTDENGALKAIALAANKFLRTDANGDLAQSDIAAWAISMLGLAGGANKLPYLNAENTAALADLTPLARNFLDDATGAAMWATMGAAGSLGNPGYIAFPNGLKMNWGNVAVTLSAGSAYTVVYPSAFQSFAVPVFNNGDTNANGNTPVGFRSGNPAGFTLFIPNSANSSARISWIAIGV